MALGLRHALLHLIRVRAKAGYIYLHSAVNGFSRLTYIEVLDDDKAATTNAFFGRARAFIPTHGIIRIHRVVIDNGAIYPAKSITGCLEALASRHQRIRPYALRHYGKVERYNRLLANEILYVRPCVGEQARRDAIEVWVNHLHYGRPHTACGEQPRPDESRPESITSCPLTLSYSHATPSLSRSMALRYPG